MAYPRFMRSRSAKFAVGNLSGDHSTASTTFADIAAAYSLMLHAQVADVLDLQFDASVVGAALLTVDFAWNVAGNDQTPYRNFDVATNPIPVSVRLLYVVQAADLTSGVVTVKPRWKTSTSTVTVRNASGRGPVVVATNIGPVDPN